MAEEPQIQEIVLEAPEGVVIKKEQDESKATFLLNNLETSKYNVMQPRIKKRIG